MKKWTQRFSRNKKRGQAVVEMALMMAFFLVFMLALIDLGRVFFVMVAVQNAAGEGALFGMGSTQCLSAANCADPDNIEYRVKNESNSRLVDPDDYTINVTFNPDPAVPGGMIIVEVIYDFRPILPALSAFGADVIPIRRTAIQLIP
ncbi:MAG: pilus assembly protein [Chloroflexia bacterium]|nr:pilus assembly protein [Chloroflexia bacterium]